ncbi:hypothetical protein VP01_619g7 [Puccinia sorghi]|uniref:Uncharacterized protein n=1 Tax=Puccinia sorghi TaxID=27349 RepID=A0A0L6UIU2_9BASI|nr:hypothetical protein VP01_619g7 [Puccinia sorghi]
MDPWSSNDWVEPTQPASSSSTLQHEIDLKETNDTPLPIQSAWPVPDLSLPNWDNSSPPKSPPLAASKFIGPLPHSESTHQPQLKLDSISASFEQLTINTHISSPASSSQSVFKTPDSAGSDKWTHANQSPVEEPARTSSDPAHMTSSVTTPSIGANLSHLTQESPDPEPEPDLDRWGTFTQIDLPPISSTIPFSNPDPISFPNTSPIHSGWDGETHLGGWDDSLAVDHSLPSLGTSIPTPSPPGSNHDVTDLDQASLTVAFRSILLQWFAYILLPSSSYRAATTAETIQTAMSKSAHVISNVAQSANNSRSISSNAGAQSSSTDSTKPEQSINPSNNNTSRVNFSILGASTSDASGKADASKTAQKREQQEQKKRSGFFGFWASKSSSSSSTPASPPESKTADGSTALPPVEIPGTHQSSLNNTRGSISSLDTPSSAWPAPSPASPSSTQDPSISTISRLFGRLGSRSNNASSISTSVADDQCDITAPSTELNANDITFLDNIKTVPIKPKIVPYNDFPAVNNVNSISLSAKNKNPQPESGVFDLLSDHSASPKLVSPLASQRPTSSTFSSFSKCQDPFDFLSSLSTHSAHQKRQDQGPLSGRLSPSPNLSSQSSYALSSSTGATGRKSSGNDLDDLFSSFQIAEVSTQAPTKISPRPNPPTLHGFHKAVGSKSAPTVPGSTQVRMVSTIPKPILPRDSHSFSATRAPSSSKVPILAPPPSSSRATSTTPIPLIPPPENARNHQLPPPQFNPTASSAFNAALPTTLSMNNLFSPPPPSEFTTLLPKTPKSTPNPPHKPNNQQVGGLSKEDLSFFDSLM